MDDFIDPFLSSASWLDVNMSSRSSWTDSIASQSNELLTDSVEAYGGDEKNATICMVPSAHIIRNVATEDLDLHEGRSLKYLAEHELPGHGSHSSQHNTETHESNFALNEVYESNSASGSYGRETLPHSVLTISSSIESNGSEPSKFVQSLGDTHSISSVSSMWPPSYSGVSPFIEQGKLQGFGFHGVESHADVLRTTYIENGKYPLLNNSAASSVHDCNGLSSANIPNFNSSQQMKMTNGGLHPHQQEQNGLHNLHLPSFSGMQALHQLSQSTEGNNLKHQTDQSSGMQPHLTPENNNACNGAAKSRVRARRGQATDPHSIAERLRREKIAERMKNLQELVPNSNKADKASMLDEIIDYVKFLQLQVKVLSMSRLGAAGAVLPLITDAYVEGSGNLHLSSSVCLGASDLSEAEDNLALEQEVVKLMESNVTRAMQYLQNKGVCLMPIALASAISSQKGSFAATPPNGRQPDVIKQEDSVKPI